MNEPALHPAPEGVSARAIFARLEIMGPVAALVNLADLLRRDAGGNRPDEYLADVAELQEAAERLAGMVRALHAGGDAAPADLDRALARSRHDLGNGLNRLAGLVQLLQLAEEDLFGAFLPELDQMLALCRECEARLLGLTGQDSDGRPRPGQPSAVEVAHAVAQIESPGGGVGAVQAGRILVADDDPLNRDVLTRLLTLQGHRVSEAADGEEALRRLDEEPFDVLLLDILMPGLNGFEVLRRLGDPERPCRPAVIVISALDGVGALVRCLEAGADDYLTKPVDKVLLAARINSCLQKKRQRARELGQFFPPEVVTHLLDNPEALRPQAVEVTVLFCDIRGFSRISERLEDAPDRKMGWVQAVFETLDECVVRHGGVLIDFIGDELLAMWGAPVAQPDHARRACHAAIDMLAGIDRLSAEWRGVIGEETAVGIGINTGPASVGNTGTRRRFKYGPMGNTVNLASRIQGATKYLRASAMLTEATRQALAEEFRLRRLAQVRVVNIVEPVTVYELVGEAASSWAEQKEGYETALTLYEAGPDRLEEAARILGRLAATFGLTGPGVFLLARVLGAMQDRGSWSGVYTLPGK